MFFFLSKIADFLMHPLTWVFILLVMAWRKKIWKKRKSYLIAAVAVLYFFSNQAIFHEVSSSWETKPINPNSISETYEVAIILGGMVSLDRKHQIVEFQENSDRFLNVLPLYFKGKVKRLLIAGGSGRMNQKEKEATILEDYLISIGVDAKDILIEAESRNTYENAVNSLTLLKEKNIKGPILLSTSSTHMPRSYQIFKSLGADVKPFAVDQVSYKREINPDTLFFPKASILNDWYHLIHEWIGILMYKITGYI